MVSAAFEHIALQPENPFSRLPNNQKICLIPKYTLDCGTTLRDVPVAYKTFGKLNTNRDNVMVICHALTGSADVADWWGPLLGPGKAFDTSKFFIFCGNVLGSPYGSASPCTRNPDTGKPYGADFPPTSIRDDVRIHRLVLDSMGINKVAICIGGSLGGMQALEWAMFGSDYVQNLVAIATSGKHSAWGISWGEAQRQVICSDPKFDNGNYSLEDPPKTGLAAARMAALLTYRSRNSFETRFGRNPANSDRVESKDKMFSAQSYLHYQGSKFVGRFDANCYICITNKMDTHDIGATCKSYQEALKSITQPTVIVGIETDGLFTISEQVELAEEIPRAQLKRIESPDGHDGFLLEFEQLNRIILDFIDENLGQLELSIAEEESELVNTTFSATKPSLFGEAEDDLAKW